MSRISLVDRIFLIGVCILCFSFAIGAKNITGKITSVAGYARAGKHLSPDKKFVAHIPTESQRKDYQLTVYKVAKRNPVVMVRKDLYHGSINGLVWVPKRPHSFVFSAKASSGQAFIGIWSGGNSIRLLRVGNLPPNTDPDSQYFQLVGIRSDGEVLIYKHYDATTARKSRTADSDFEVKRYMRLPQ